MPQINFCYDWEKIFETHQALSILKLQRIRTNKTLIGKMPKSGTGTQ